MNYTGNIIGATRNKLLNFGRDPGHCHDVGTRKKNVGLILKNKMAAIASYFKII